MVMTYTSRDGLRVRNVEISMRTRNQLHVIRHTGYQRSSELATGTDDEDPHGLNTRPGAMAIARLGGMSVIENARHRCPEWNATRVYWQRAVARHSAAFPMDVAVDRPATRYGLSFKELLEVLRHGRLLVGSVTLVFTLVAGAAAWLLPKEYEADIVLSPVMNTPGEGPMSPMGSLASQFGGLASLAGLSLGGQSKRAESVAVLESGELTEKYIRENNLLPVLYPKLWDPVGHKWRVSDPDDLPTLWKANERFRKQIRSVKTDIRTGLVTLTVLWRDPVIAATWANGLVRMTNDYLRVKAINEAERNIAYLNAEAAKTTVVEARQAIFAVLQHELNKSMLARGSDEYALHVLDSALAPERAAYPQKALWLCVGLVVGLVCSAFVVILRAAIQ